MSKPKPWISLQVPAGHPLSIFADARATPAPPLAGALNFLHGGPVAATVMVPVPDLSTFPAPRDKAQYLLSRAAGIEHALLAQYLYVGYSINPEALGLPILVRQQLRQAKKQIGQIAIEEMSHLMSVQNLLLMIGGSPTIRRIDKQETSGVPIIPFDLRLERLSKQALAKFVVIEAPAHAEQFEPSYAAIAAIAGMDQVQMIKQVGMLYALLGVVFGTEAVLNQRAQHFGNGSWDETVKLLADEIAGDPIISIQYGSRTGMHLSAGDFLTGPAGDPFLRRQGTDDEWDRGNRQTSFRVFAPRTRDAALETLKDISLQGEAPVGTAPTETSHFRRFVDQSKVLYGPDGQQPEPAGIFDVPQGAVISISQTNGDESVISHPEARRWARLAELRYWILLGSLDQYLISPAEDRDFLVAWCMTEMYHLKRCGEFLPRRPRTNGQPPGNAAIPFNGPLKLPSEVPINPGAVTGTRTPWPDLLAKWLEEARAITTALLPTLQDAEEEQMIQYMQETDNRKLLEARARTSGCTVRTTFDLVREILEWGAGAAHPVKHEGLARFWNLPLAKLKAATISDTPIIGTIGDSQLLSVLQEGFMPGGGRGKLNTSVHQPTIDAIESWIADGCPETQTISSFEEQLRQSKE